MLALVYVISGCLLVVLAVLFIAWRHLKQPDMMEQLGVRSVYPHQFSTERIDQYYELKDKVRNEYCKAGQADDCDRWMASLPFSAKDSLKYRLMQRAIGDMAALKQVDSDARGFWKLFTKGVITKQFWDSVTDAERELSLELESVKAEASFIEPSQDPQGIINEAMQFVVRYGDKLPMSGSDLSAPTKDILADLMRQLPVPKSLGGAPPPMPPGMAGMGFPGLGGPAGLSGPGGQLPGLPPKAAAPPPPSSGSGEAYQWKQDAEEVELSVSVSPTATKAEVKVTLLPKAVKVVHKGEVIVEGTLAGMCDPEGSTWTLSKGRVVVSLEKAGGKPWPALFAPGRA